MDWTTRVSLAFYSNWWLSSWSLSFASPVDNSSFLAFNIPISLELVSYVCAIGSLAFNKTISSSLALRRAIMPSISCLSLSSSSSNILLNFVVLPSMHSHYISVSKEKVCFIIPLGLYSKGNPKCRKILVQK